MVGACSRIHLLEDSYKVLQQKLIAQNPLENFQAVMKQGVATMPFFEVNPFVVNKFVQNVGQLQYHYDLHAKEVTRGVLQENVGDAFMYQHGGSAAATVPQQLS